VTVGPLIVRLLPLRDYTERRRKRRSPQITRTIGIRKKKQQKKKQQKSTNYTDYTKRRRDRTGPGSGEDDRRFEQIASHCSSPPHLPTPLLLSFFCCFSSCNPCNSWTLAFLLLLLL